MMLTRWSWLFLWSSCRLGKHCLMGNCWMCTLLVLSISIYLVWRWHTMILKLLILITTRIWSGCWRQVANFTHFPTLFVIYLLVIISVFIKNMPSVYLDDFLLNLNYQNDVSDIPDLTFSMDADEEKHILYEKNEVFKHVVCWYLSGFDCLFMYLFIYLLTFVHTLCCVNISVFYTTVIYSEEFPLLLPHFQYCEIGHWLWA